MKRISTCSCVSEEGEQTVGTNINRLTLMLESTFFSSSHDKSLAETGIKKVELSWIWLTTNLSLKRRGTTLKCHDALERLCECWRLRWHVDWYPGDNKQKTIKRSEWRKTGETNRNKMNFPCSPDLRSSGFHVKWSCYLHYHMLDKLDQMSDQIDH